MRPRIFQIHIKAIDEAWQSIRRLEDNDKYICRKY
jgi:hypothetical protein